MKKTPLAIDMKKGDQSNYIITIDINTDQKKYHRDRVILGYQQEATKPGFRKGHVPLQMVEEMVDPNTVMMATLEEIMNQALQQVVESYKDYKWIGQAYNLNTKDYKDANESGKLSFSLDVFPEVVEKNVTWKKHKADKYSTVVTQEDIDATVDQLRSSYAQFEDVEIVDTESLMRLKVTYQNKKGEMIGNSKNQYLGQEDLAKHSTIQKLFISKKKGDIVEIEYKKAADLTVLAYGVANETPSMVVCEIIEIKKKVLPALNQEFINKTFSEDDNITSVEILMEKIRETLETNKEQNALYEWVDIYLKAINSSFEIALPQTLIDEEMKNRLEHLSKQLGGEKGLKAYLERMGEKESEAYIETIKEASITSIRKYFVMKHICDALGLEMDRSKAHTDGEVEKKLYEKITA